MSEPLEDRLFALEVRMTTLENRLEAHLRGVRPNDTRSLEEILAVVEEIRAWTKRLRIE